MLGAFRRRFTHYAVFTVIFGLAYVGFIVATGGFPTPLVIGILLVSLGKDLLDEYRIQRGEGPLAFFMIEHLPSNLVLLALLLTDVIDPSIAVSIPGGVSLRSILVGLAIVDTLLDLSQDLRVA